MRQPPILMYHWFRAGAGGPASRSPQLEIDAALFDRQMRLLRRLGYRSVPLRSLLQPREDAERRGRSVVITFDDGTSDFWTEAKPTLERYGFRATLFVVTGFVGTESGWDRDVGEPSRPLLSWAQIEELHRDGFEIASHSHTHRPFTGLTLEEVREELSRSRTVLRDRLGEAPEFVAYPRGAYAPEHKRIALETGYAGACAVALRWRDLLHSDRYALKRMTIKGNESLWRFRLRLALGGWIRLAVGGPGPRGG